MKNKTHKLLFYFFLTIIGAVSFFTFSPSVSAETHVSGAINGSAIWFKAQGPYIVDSRIDILPDASLEIQPGVVVKIAPYTDIKVQGTLTAIGTESDKIYFTSLADDEIGGDTNGDATATAPSLQDYVNIWSGIRNVGPASMYFDHAVFRYAENAISVQRTPNITILNSVFEKNLSGISDKGENTVQISGTRLSDNYTGISLAQRDTNQNSVYVAQGLSIFGNSQYGVRNIVTITHNEGMSRANTIGRFFASMLGTKVAYADPMAYDYTLDLRNTWWGDASGPEHDTLNPSGHGNKISDNILFDPWCSDESCTPAPTYQCSDTLDNDNDGKTDYPADLGCSSATDDDESGDPIKKTPVIIIPGVTGTRLLENYGDGNEIWPSVTKLALSIPDNFLDVLALNPDGTERSEFSIKTGDIIREAAGMHVFDNMIADLEAKGYKEGVDLFVFPYDWRYSTARSAEELSQKIDQILLDNGKEKVDIIAHSMGGIVAKKYIADNGKDKIDKLIFLGTPHLGSPKAFKALEWGDGMDFSYHALNSSEIKSISQNFPSMFELLPSKEYVDDKDNKYVLVLTGGYKFESGLTKLAIDYADTKDLMTKDGRNTAFFGDAETIHNQTDNIDLSGINVFNFSGCSTATPGKFTITRHSPKKVLGITVDKGYDIDYVDGDQTVPLSSSDDEVGGEQYFVKGVSHGSLPDDVGVRKSVLSILSGESPASQDDIVSIDQCGIDGTEISIHSPVSLSVTDDLGNHTGPTNTRDMEYNVPGVQYDTINDEKFTFLPAGGTYHITLNPEALGTYDMYIDTIVDGVKISEKYFNEVPISDITSRYTFDVTPAENNNFYVSLYPNDTTGDFYPLFPSAILDQSQLVDIVPPETTIFSEAGQVTLDASDDGAGVLKTEYSFDDGQTWEEYRYFLEPGDIDKIEYYSTDRAGNIEQTKELVFREKPVVKDEDLAPTKPPEDKVSTDTSVVKNQPSSGGGLIMLNNKNTDVLVRSQTPPNLPLSREEEIQKQDKVASYYPPENLSRVSSREGDTGGLVSRTESDQTPSPSGSSPLLRGSEELQTASAGNSTSKIPSAKVLLGVFAGAMTLGFVAKRFIKL